METITATYRVVTPMFMSGADQAKAELRLPSIKGVLRFWWRALAWERLGGDMGAIRDEEALIFGSTKRQAAVLMKLEPAQFETVAKGKVLEDNGRVVGEGARYLGYGVMEAFASRNKGTQAGELKRACIQVPVSFTLQFAFKASISDTLRDSVSDALKCLGLVGGLGSKARKGYGSLTLEVLERNGEAFWSAPKTPEELVSALQRLTKTRRDGEPQYTAFSKDARVVLLPGNGGESALGLLNRIGRDQVFYRSWGQGGTVLREPSEKNFKDDHDLMKMVAAGRPTQTHPRRIAFGLPHNYGRSRQEQVEPDDHDRRASPLFIHIHQPKGQPPIGVLLFLPAQFLPEGERVKVGGQPVTLKRDTLWNPIHDFMNRVIDPRQGKEQFRGVLEVTRD
jgi:CRISPR-associated protein Cmr1